jgi:hypothetical protein
VALVDCGRPQTDAWFTEHQMKKGISESLTLT